MRTFSTLLFMLMVVHCFAGDQIQVLKVDDEHFWLLHTNTPSYQIQPCQTVILDSTHYTFTKPALIHSKPLSTICMFGVSGTNMAGYQLDWKPGKTRYEISGATLTPCDESPHFDGFKSGQQWNIGIYADYETNKSLAAWYGVIEVR